MRVFRFKNDFERFYSHNQTKKWENEKIRFVIMHASYFALAFRHVLSPMAVFSFIDQITINKKLCCVRPNGFLTCDWLFCKVSMNITWICSKQCHNHNHYYVYVKRFYLWHLCDRRQIPTRIVENRMLCIFHDELLRYLTRNLIAISVDVILSSGISGSSCHLTNQHVVELWRIC